MTQVYTAEGGLVPVTVIQAGPCTVVAARRRRSATATPPCSSASARRRRSALVEGRCRAQFAKAGKGAFARPARVPPRPTASRPRSGSDVTRRRRLPGRRARRRHRHHQGPRHGRRHQAPPLQRLSRLATARTSTSGTAARSATARTRAASSRASAWRAASAPSASPRAISRSSRCAPTRTCCSSAARCPGARDGIVVVRRRAAERDAVGRWRSDTVTLPVVSQTRAAGRRGRAAGAAVRRAGARAPAARGGAEPARVAAAPARRDQDARLRPRRRQEAVAAEGHRPRPRRQHPLADLGRRRRPSSGRSRATTPTACRSARGARRCARRSPTRHATEQLVGRRRDRRSPRPKTKRMVEMLDGARPRAAACWSSSPTPTTASSARRATCRA